MTADGIRRPRTLALLIDRKAGVRERWPSPGLFRLARHPRTRRLSFSGHEWLPGCGSQRGADPFTVAPGAAVGGRRRRRRRRRQREVRGRAAHSEFVGNGGCLHKVATVPRSIGTHSWLPLSQKLISYCPTEVGSSANYSTAPLHYTA